MESILKYRKRDELYRFLIEDFGMIKIAEEFDSKNFGNFYITLSSKDFLLDYINDRSFLDVFIRSKKDSNGLICLSFLKNYLYNSSNINNNNEGSDNKSRIEGLNNFLKTDFDTISKLVSEDNFLDTKTNIDKLLKEQFMKKFPNAVK